MKDYDSSVNVVSPGQLANAEGTSVRSSEHTHAEIAGQHTPDELATALAMMHATLESTTDAILVTDEANYVRGQEKWAQELLRVKQLQGEAAAIELAKGSAKYPKIWRKK